MKRLRIKSGSQPKPVLIVSQTLGPSFSLFFSNLKAFLYFLQDYLRSKILAFSDFFESNKNSVVRHVLIKRGKRNRLFSHTSVMVVLGIGVVISPFVSDSNLFSNSEALLVQQVQGADSLVTDDVFQTQISEKPRDTVITYTVQKGDTISTIAKKFGVDENTIRWENEITGDRITVGDEIRILPVSGMAHKVKRGDTVYSIAERYAANPQAIVDYPFNDFANPQTFSLVEGQVIIVPDGVKPEEKQTIVRRRFVAQGPVSVSGAGFTWPVRGTLNQYFAWYHTGIDIGADIGTPIVAAHSGTAAQVYTSGWHGGYGVHVIVAGDNGYSTLYAHMSAVNVSPGDSVTAGSTVLGWIGMTGRTTGPHLHFEIRGAGGNQNPMSFLQ